MNKFLKNCLFLTLTVVVTGCSDLGHSEVEKLLSESGVYPITVEMRIYTNDEKTALEVTEKNLVKDGLATAQLKHTMDDVGQPLVRFTDLAKPYLLQTDDTLKSFDVQRVRVGDEVFDHVKKIEINPAGDKAVVDYTTSITNRTPFSVLYKSNVDGELKRRTFFSKKDDQWTWDGKIIKMVR